MNPRSLGPESMLLTVTSRSLSIGIRYSISVVDAINKSTTEIKSKLLTQTRVSERKKPVPHEQKSIIRTTC